MLAVNSTAEAIELAYKYLSASEFDAVVDLPANHRHWSNHARES
ncbi:MAG: hypothetical protein U0075_10530 [Thermomicrobiales bacterium]